MNSSLNESEGARPQMPGLTPTEFLQVATERLANTALLELLVGTALPTDEQGLIAAHVSDNLRGVFTVAERMTPDPSVREKCGQMLGLWTLRAES